MDIILCDDNSAFIEELKSAIETEYDTVNVSCCCSVRELNKLCARYTYQLAFIDIVLDEDNKDSDDGISAAIKLMNCSPDMKVVFITSYMERYADEIYSYPGYAGFIRKPLSMEKVKAYIDRRMNELARATGKLTLKRGQAEIDIPMGSIIYIESDKQRIGLALERELHNIYQSSGDDDQKIYSRTNLQKVECRLNEDFIRTHQSFIINITHSCLLIGNDIYMDNGALIAISRKYRASVRRAFFKYKGGDLL